MSVASYIQAWRVSRHLSLDALAEKCRIPGNLLAAIESGASDPAASTLTAIATALEIPPAWLYGDPKDLQLLTKYLSESDEAETSIKGTDPVLEHMLRSLSQDRTLYTLMTVLLQSGDEKLIRTAEVSLRSLVKQIKPTAVPWWSRQPGHFEPPSD